MILGAHESTAGGPAHAIERAVEDGCESIQIFVKSPRTWRAKPLSPEQVEAFRGAVAASEYPSERWTAHAGYLINFGGSDPERWRKSVASFVDECRRCRELGIPTIVVHPGSHKGVGLEHGIAKTVEALDAVVAEVGTDGPRILLESMPGAGDQLCSRPEEIAAILERVRHPEALGVCLDTCHMWVAGIPLWPLEAYEGTMARLDELFGLDRVAVWHLNDAKGAFGSHLDRHEHIGEGRIPLELFARLVNDPRWTGVLGVLETPELPDGRRGFRENLERLKALRRPGAPDAPGASD